MPLYETVFIARQDLSGPQVEGIIEQYANVIKEGGGNVVSKENWGLKNFAYRIKKNRKGHYVLFNLDSPSSAVKEMERQMGINEDILRFLTVKVEALEEGPSAMMQSRGQREERSDRPSRGGRGERGERRFNDEGDLS